MSADKTIDVVARTIYGEARGEGEIGKIAVGWVIRNRVEAAFRNGGHYWWGSNYEEVCLKPYQFSCWNDNDPNRNEICTVTEQNKCFATCKKIAAGIINGNIHNPVGNSTHYHTINIHPRWADGKKPVCSIGHHVFYFMP